jgi:hypothetical protein
MSNETYFAMHDFTISKILQHFVDDRADYRKSSYASSGLLRIRIGLGLVYMWSKYQGMLYSTKCPKSDLR